MKNGNYTIFYKSDDSLLRDGLTHEEAVRLLELIGNKSSVYVKPALPANSPDDSEPDHKDGQLYVVFDRKNGKAVAPAMVRSELDKWMSGKDTSLYDVDEEPVEFDQVSWERDMGCYKPAYEHEIERLKKYNPELLKEMEAFEKARRKRLEASPTENTGKQSNAIKWTLFILGGFIAFRIFLLVFEGLIFPLIVELVWVGIPMLVLFGGGYYLFSFLKQNKD